jgi:hypothetical protein
MKYWRKIVQKGQGLKNSPDSPEKKESRTLPHEKTLNQSFIYV